MICYAHSTPFSFSFFLFFILFFFRIVYRVYLLWSSFSIVADISFSTYFGPVCFGYSASFRVLLINAFDCLYGCMFRVLCVLCGLGGLLYFLIPCIIARCILLYLVCDHERVRS